MSTRVGKAHGYGRMLRMAAVFLLAVVVVPVAWQPNDARAQAPSSSSAVPNSAPSQAASPGLPIPSFWDPRRRPERPDLRLTLIRFESEVDYPPFNYAAADGNPTGFNVELARMICEELKVECTIQMRRFDTLIDALNENKADAAIASISVTPETRKRVDFSDPYYRPVARFVARSDKAWQTVTPESAEGKKIGVVGGSAHEAYLRTLFTSAELVPFRTADEARAALRSGQVDLLFGDGFALAFWLNGTDADGCCSFVGGPFIEGRYFGEGIGVAVKRGNDVLRQAVNWALFRLWEKGKFADLWLKYFPINPF